jgi:hypothetical protein
MAAAQTALGKTLTVKVLPQSEGATLCVELDGLITREDYEHNFRNRIIDIVRKQSKVNLLMYYAPSYKGWEPGAADLSLKSIMELGHKIRRQAYINAPKKIFFRNKLSAALFSGKMRYFEDGRLDEALAWVKGED